MKVANCCMFFSVNIRNTSNSDVKTSYCVINMFPFRTWGKYSKLDTIVWTMMPFDWNYFKPFTLLSRNCCVRKRF